MSKRFYHVTEKEINKFAKEVANQAKNRYIPVAITNKNTTEEELNANMQECFKLLKKGA